MPAALAVAAALSLGDLGVAAFFGSGNLLTLPLLLYERMGAYRMEEAASVALLLSRWCSAFSSPRRDGREIRLLEVADLTLDYPDFHARYTLTVPAGALAA